MFDLMLEKIFAEYGIFMLQTFNLQLTIRQPKWLVPCLTDKWFILYLKVIVFASGIA